MLHTILDVTQADIRDKMYVATLSAPLSDG
jgi:hypothetical protein